MLSPAPSPTTSSANPIAGEARPGSGRYCTPLSSRTRAPFWYTSTSNVSRSPISDARSAGSHGACWNRRSSSRSSISWSWTSTARGSMRTAAYSPRSTVGVSAIFAVQAAGSVLETSIEGGVAASMDCSSIAFCVASGIIRLRVSSRIAPLPRYRSSITRGALPFRKPGILARCTSDWYARCRYRSTSSGSASMLSTTSRRGRFSTVTFTSGFLGG